MKIAIVRQRYNPYGGAERFVERALGALAEEGAEVTLITRNWDGAPREGFRQIACDPPYSRLFGGRAARDRSFATAAARLMAAGDFDITQSHERLPGCMIFRAGDGVHAAWLAHRGRTLSSVGRLAQRLSPYHRYVLQAERAMLTHPALRAVICNSHMVADELQHYYGLSPDRLPVIYNGVDTEAFSPALSRQYRRSIRAAAGIPEDAPLLLYVGSGFERKGVFRLLQAWTGLSHKDAFLVIVGADRRAAQAARLAERLGIAGRVRFTGPLRDVRPWYGAADGFALPTLYDPCPNAALEALACGLPVVTTTTCGAQEWIKSGENGYVVDPCDLGALRVALDALCDMTHAPGVRESARSAVQDLTLPAMAARLLGLYQALAG